VFHPDGTGLGAVLNAAGAEPAFVGVCQYRGTTSLGIRHEHVATAHVHTAVAANANLGIDYDHPAGSGGVGDQLGLFIHRPFSGFFRQLFLVVQALAQDDSTPHGAL
jgi:hypothetical protein